MTDVSHELPHVCPNCGAAMTAPGKLEQEVERLRTACDLFIKHGTPVFDPASLSMWQLAQGLMWKSGDDSNEAEQAGGVK